MWKLADLVEVRRELCEFRVIRLFNRHPNKDGFRLLFCFSFHWKTFRGHFHVLNLALRNHKTQTKASKVQVTAVY